MLNYSKFIKQRQRFLKENKDIDFVYEDNNSNILISAPHGVPQTRLGKAKHEEPGSLSFAIELKNRTQTNFIAKTSNNFDDVNFDAHSPYKTQIKREIEKGKIKYIIDFHGLAKKQEMDVNLGINFGENIHKNPSVFYDLKRKLEEENFEVTVDTPYCANIQTIAGTFGKKIWAIQVEINSRITNVPYEKERLSILLQTFENWIKTLK